MSVASSERRAPARGDRRTRRGRTSAPDDRRALSRNGLPADVDPSVPLPKRLLRNRLFWVSVAVLLGYVACLLLLYRQVVPDQEVPGGTIPGLGTEALPIAARYAAITAVPLSLVFLWADRFRPQRIWVWLMTFGWGACVATFVSAQVNTWAASQLSIAGDGDPATGARAAIFVAPFVEEAAKGTVLFWLAILMRYQWVSRLSGIVLAGLSGAAFAFVENILYYGRAYRFAARTFGQVPPLEALQQLFVLRGLITFFGHPLFTAMLGIGLAVALRSKSKTVRVVAPLAGYLAAAFLHMAFNTTASLTQGRSQLFVYLFVALPLVVGVVVFVVRQLFREGRLIRDRLVDYVRVGWLPEGDPAALSRLRTRSKAVWHALFLGPDRLLATLRMQRAATELAYLRDSMVRGLVDEAGTRRERVLLARIRSLRAAAVTQPEGRAAYPSLRRRRTAGAPGGYAPASYPGPAGLGGNYPAPALTARPPGVPPSASAPLGQTATQYSEVDPTWKPPGE
ncbi:PrsW family glutamic-type intramembrane protease [Microlunatus capsulatus]|uniref:RsiW-degrading membrane proteinase PrsW (M82 family) n=1 Tax=Microlunatus capsulatus TaxID=99117 RepID=A0ABS4Z5E8_9ACTN|nr:PrsW family intramembrane metalloprotease [Microlunatus capsulatus]MBP2416260.1 RsiW-degrading membrane proteinase PrsW (M82 family) [Microlunatus capsulatus]